MIDGHASMIAADSGHDGAPLLRKQFHLDAGHGALRQATLRQTFLGIGETTINGAPASPEVLAPGWSSYEWRLRYTTLDVTDLISQTNVIVLALGNGWYRGHLCAFGTKAVYGAELAAWAQLDLVFQDGHTQQVVTDLSWRSGPSAITANDLYHGQTIDARLHDRRCYQTDFDDKQWEGVHRVDFDPGRLTPTTAQQPVIRQQELPPGRIFHSPSGKTLIDFGQNMVGWVRLAVQGDAGSVITLRHAEVLENGELGVRPLRTARATDRFILSGGQDTFEPTFTFHGFRYVEVDGWPGDITPEALRAVVIGSDLQRTGLFECSDPMLNQLHANIVWGMRGNFVSLPTDCPARDERLGWTGDLAVFTPAACFLFDVNDFLREWLHDLVAEQDHHGGIVPLVVPDALKYEDRKNVPPLETVPMFCDAAVWVPWAHWQAYGNRAVLEDQFGSMTTHTRLVRAALSPTGLWDTGFQLGDWLDPQAPPDEPLLSKADKGVVSTACAYRSATHTAQAAAILGLTSEQEEFTAMAAELRRAYNTHYVNDGHITSDCATVYAQAIELDLLDDDDRAKAGHRLSELVRENDYRISTGFIGTPLITDALTNTGHLDDAYRLLLQRECPSWLYPVTMGATTIWERWDAMLPDGSINPGEMTSFNHYALGAVADWMHRTIGGLAPAAPGYQRILVRPRPGGGLTHATTTLQTPHGLAAVEWRRHGETLTVTATIPEGCTAQVDLPHSTPQEVGPGTHTHSIDYPAGDEDALSK